MRTLSARRLTRSAPRDPVIVSLQRVPEQIRQVVRDFRPVLTAAARRSHTLAVVGMGGSALGADLVRGLTLRALKQQLAVIRAPELPRAVGPGTVVVASSYSGTTAETIAAAREARRRRLPLICVTTGGKLAALARLWQTPLCLIDPSINPSGQPRLGLGALTTTLLVVLRQLGWWSFSEADQRAVDAALRAAWSTYGPEQPRPQNGLRRLARQLRSRFILAVASDRYFGNAHILANQLNENAKTFAVPFALPELNHHLLEGLRFPTAARSAAGIFFQGVGDKPLGLRFRLTQEVFARNRVPSFVLRPIGGRPLAQAFGWLAQTGLLSYYLALEHRVDPLPIPWVDFFKRSLSRGQ